MIEHAITTTLPFQRQGKVPSTRPTIAPGERPWNHNYDPDSFTSPILDFSPPFTSYPFEPDRKNSTCPAPPGRFANNNNKPKASQSSSSDEASPLTPRDRYPVDALDYHLDQRRQQQLPPCARCKRDVTNDMKAMRIGQDVYHGQCFSCYTCRNRLDPLKPTLEYQGRIYCETDYNMMVRHKLTCAACEQTIAAHVRPTRALGNYYHPEHIRCFHCNKPVDPDMTGLVERKGKIFCRPDFNKLYLPKCRGCGRAVEKEAVSSADGRLKGKWHKHCFRCHECHEPFPNNTFYIFENTPYCRRDYHKMNRSLCKACDEPVEGRCARTAEGWRFHPNCFTCCVCKCMITDVYYLSDNRIYCANDRLFRSEKRQTFFQQL
ncbi:hypothetical protein BX666DRAFT_1894177 [Dichotomocladium elegans]|nr:hypothetical protein BX666DRAFT_1894177 [Dichotomocladium elegans]